MRRNEIDRQNASTGKRQERVLARSYHEMATHNVIGSNTCRDTKPEILGSVHHFPRQVTRMEGGSDKDVGILDVLPELAVRTFFVRGGDQFVALFLKPLSDSQLVLGSP
jgi:hypothetical protein